ncbi:acetolactate synthase-1/2/3 large subunit [Symbiobacterium terraclitae]|uniref:Acetolactate synthase n=1 Tax=Symbiobacterium terraclitae TaxID=557451 RepID=A0ABS4JQU0_9FIRM|nr:biosynthetic-type acetolactate synthase large subunit [Symbiobacterium terraclitae]MBP2017904.1 acetolactate synthase-1/2/3 large subunit [Symbiobacterium terraclitae]
MEMQAAAALLKALEAEGVEVIFGYPGGASLYIYDALYDSPVRHVLTRHEQGAIHAAEGYARTTGRVGVVLATSGPGATNLVTGLCDAMMDSTPIVAITGQVPRQLIGRDAFQEADVTGITMPVTKHNYLVTDPGDLLRVVREAFHIARTGRPGPVLIDIPKDVTSAPVRYDYPPPIHLPGYRIPGEAAPEAVAAAAEAIRTAQRPVLICGGGVVSSEDAAGPFRALAERMDAPVVETLMGLGGFPMDHPQCLGLLGMHGTFAANRAVANSDLLIACGMRFDDRVTGMAARFAPKARVIHIDIDPAEMSKNLPSHIQLVGDCGLVLAQLNEALGDWSQKLPEWRAQVQAWHEQYPLWGVRRGEEIPTDPAGVPKPQQVIQAVQETFGPQAIVATDVGQHQMWAAHYCTRTEPRTWLSSCGLGTMGFGLPAAIGAAIGRPDREVVLITGDGSIQMCIQELATVVQENLPVKIVLLNNGYLGMVRQWQEMFYKGRYKEVDLRRGMPDFVKLAEAYGIRGMRVRRLGELTGAMAEVREHRGPVFLDVQVQQEENVFPIVPPGGANTEALLDAKR